MNRWLFMYFSRTHTMLSSFKRAACFSVVFTKKSDNAGSMSVRGKLNKLFGVTDVRDDVGVTGHTMAQLLGHPRRLTHAWQKWCRRGFESCFFLALHRASEQTHGVHTDTSLCDSLSSVATCSIFSVSFWKLMCAGNFTISPSPC